MNRTFNRNRRGRITLYSTAPPAPRHSKGWWVGVGIFVLLFLAFVVVVGGRALYQATETTVDTHVVSKERVCDSTGCQYLVYADDQTYKLVDTLGFFAPSVRLNTSDTYGRIKEDCPATITSMGWRLGLFSEYKNIIDISQPEMC